MRLKRLSARDGTRQGYSNLKRSRKQEKSTAGDIGGSITPASGSKWHSKGDVKSDTLLVECKTTEAGQFIIKLADLKKILLQAIMANKTPVFQVQMRDGKSWAVVEWEVFLEVWNAHRSNRNP